VSNYVAVYGDFSNYVIADKIGMSVEFIPHLFHLTTNRPSGSRGWYAHSRVGADSVNDGAFRMLDVPSAA
jgi:HK97 family phage major capsid protein